MAAVLLLSPLHEPVPSLQHSPGREARCRRFAGDRKVRDSAGIVGELRGRIEDDALHIVELAVAGTFQQRGIGRALIDAAQVWARARGLHALTLTTFRHVAWNAPFYARYGFFELADAELDQRLATILREEAAYGLPDRCAMRLAIK